MEDKRLNEKESLELISQMIQNTRKNMELGSGNIMLLWGYITLAAAAIVYAGMLMTHSILWNFAWFGIPLVGYPVMMYLYRKKAAMVKSYTDKAIDAVWTIMGITMMAATAFFCLRGMGTTLIPLCLILVGIGMAMTMALLRETWLQIFSFVAIGIGMYLLSEYTGVRSLPLSSILYFVIGFIIALIVPGHYLNYKSRKYV